MPDRPDERERLPFVQLRTTIHHPPTERRQTSAGRRKARAQWRVAPPLRLFTHFGRKAPVTVTLQLRISAETWVEVRDHRGRFWIHHDASVVDLIQKLQEGGYYVDPAPSTTSARRRGSAGGD